MPGPMNSTIAGHRILGSFTVIRTEEGRCYAEQCTFESISLCMPDVSASWKILPIIRSFHISRGRCFSGIEIPLLVFLARAGNWCPSAMIAVRELFESLRDIVSNGQSNEESWLQFLRLRWPVPLWPGAWRWPLPFPFAEVVLLLLMLVVVVVTNDNDHELITFPYPRTLGTSAGRSGRIVIWY
jgi:hypothetical protein